MDIFKLEGAIVIFMLLDKRWFNIFWAYIYHQFLQRKPQYLFNHIRETHNKNLSNKGKDSWIIFA
jgi:hypothetical protein